MSPMCSIIVASEIGTIAIIAERIVVPFDQSIPPNTVFFQLTGKSISAPSPKILPEPMLSRTW